MTARVHDVIVVGSGIGGLTAAALCADAGLDVVVLEGHTRPGGCAGDFRRRGVLFPAGATVVMGFEPGGLHRWVYQRLGLPVAARRLDEAMRVLLPGREVVVPTSPLAWEAERRRAFPGLGRGGDRFWGRVRQVGGAAHALAGRRPTLPIATLGDALDALHLVSPTLLGALPALRQTIGDWLRRDRIDGDQAHRLFVDNQLLISTQCLADTCVALNGALALEVYHHGTFALPGGTATIARDLVAALEARGGACRYRSWVRSVERRGDRWTATTADSAWVEGRVVIANLPPANLVGLLAGERRQTLDGAVRRAVQPWGAVVLFAALDGDGGPGPLPRFVQVVAGDGQALEDGGSCFVSLYGPEDGRPGSPARLTVSTHTRAERWWALADRAAYQAEKQRIGERLLSAAERALPGVRALVRFAEVATPRSYWRWTGRHEGRVGGVAQTAASANLRALSHHTGLPGLFLCGDSVFPGQGTIGVTLSGINAARAAVRHLTRPSVRRWLGAWPGSGSGARSAAGAERPDAPAEQPR